MASSCACPLKIHERRRKTKHPVRVPILTVEEHFFLLSIVVNDAIKVRRKAVRGMKRSDERTALKKGLAMLLAIRRELYRS